MAGEVLLGYDGSEGAKAALPEALAIAKAFAVPLVVAFGYEPSPLGGEVADIRKTIQAHGRAVLDEAAAAAAAIDASVPVQTVLVDDRPAEGLAREGESRQARMIVVGGNGRGPIAGTLLGSVSYRLLHRATTPVLVVQPES